MNGTMINRLVQKDWSFQRTPIVSAFAVGFVALALLSAGGNGTFYAGSVLLITVVIGLGAQLVIATVIQERSDGTLRFVMSLPVSVNEYTAAKLLANLLMFLVPWTALGIGTTAVILTRTGIPDGMLPFALLLLGELLAGYVLMLGVALVSESMGWTVGAMVFGNLFVNGFIYYTAHVPSIAAAMPTERITWDRPVILLMLAELAVIGLILLVTWRLQSRKTDFL